MMVRYMHPDMSPAHYKAGREFPSGCKASPLRSFGGARRKQVQPTGLGGSQPSGSLAFLLFSV